MTNKRKNKNQCNEAKYWIIPEFRNLELLRATYYTHEFTPHYHDGFAIGVIQKGAQKVKYRRANIIMPEGTVCVLNPNEIHTGKPATEAGWAYRMFYPDVEILKEISSEIAEYESDVPFFSKTVIKDDILLNQILKMHILFEDKNTPKLVLQSVFHSTVANIIIKYADIHVLKREPPQVHSSVEKARDYIEAFYFQDITLKELSNIACLSPFHLLRIFKQAIGIPPHVYLLHKRIEKAKELLLKGINIASIAYETGFADQSHLTNTLRSFVGVTPNQFRKTAIFYKN